MGEDEWSVTLNESSQGSQNSDSEVDTPEITDGDASSQTRVPQFLLLSVNTKNSTTLAQIEVSTFTNDQYLFQELQRAYEKIRQGHEWILLMFIPKLARDTFQALRKRLPMLNIISFFLKLPRMTNSTRLAMLIPAFVRDFLGKVQKRLPTLNLTNFVPQTLNLQKVASGDFVRVSILFLI